MASTFRALAALAEWKEAAVEAPEESAALVVPDALPPVAAPAPLSVLPLNPALHYNIQIHLPESRDPAVFDAIFQALRKHIF